MQTASYADWRSALAQGLNSELYPVDYLDQRLSEGTAYLFATDTAATVAEIRTYPSGVKALHFLVGAGDLGELIETLRPEIEAQAKAAGCTKALIESREGWAKALRPHGYEIFQVSLMKAL